MKSYFLANILSFSLKAAAVVILIGLSTTNGYTASEPESAPAVGTAKVEPMLSAEEFRKQEDWRKAIAVRTQPISPSRLAPT